MLTLSRLLCRVEALVIYFLRKAVFPLNLLNLMLCEEKKRIYLFVSGCVVA